MRNLPPVKSQREKWRAEINELEAELAALTDEKE